MYLSATRSSLSPRRAKSRLNLRNSGLMDPSLTEAELAAEGQDRLFRGLWSPGKATVPPHQILPLLNQTLKTIEASRPRAPADEAQKKWARFQRLNVLRNTVLGGLAAVAYHDALGFALANACDGSSPLDGALTSLLRGRCTYQTRRADFEPDRVPKLPSDAVYWSTPAVRGPYPSRGDHRLAQSTVEGQLHPAMNWALLQAHQEASGRAFLDEALTIHERHRDLRTWLRDNTHYVGSGSPPIQTFEASLAALPAENLAMLHQILNGWIEAVFIDLPQRLQGEALDRFYELTATRALFEKALLDNWVTLALLPASVGHEKVRSIFGDPPRRAHSLPPGLLKAELAQRSDGRWTLVASWRVPALEEALDNPGKCPGVRMIGGSDLRHQMIVETLTMFLTHHGLLAPSAHVWTRRLTMVAIAWFLLVRNSSALSDWLSQLAPWMDLAEGLGQFPAGQMRRDRTLAEIRARGFDRIETLKLDPLHGWAPVYKMEGATGVC